MTPVTEDEAIQNLAKSILLQAVDDYLTLKKRGGFLVDGKKINHNLWKRSEKGLLLKHPILYRKPTEVEELLYFFQEWPLDLLCDLIGHKACRIRTALGIRK